MFSFSIIFPFYIYPLFEEYNYYSFKYSVVPPSSRNCDSNNPTHIDRVSAAVDRAAAARSYIIDNVQPGERVSYRRRRRRRHYLCYFRLDVVLAIAADVAVVLCMRTFRNQWSRNHGRPSSFVGVRHRAFTALGVWFFYANIRVRSIYRKINLLHAHHYPLADSIALDIYRCILCGFTIFAATATDHLCPLASRNMSVAVLAAVAVFFILVFRMLNASSQPQKPAFFCKDKQFLNRVFKFAPQLEEP